jgi:hypothetical protein
MVNFLFGFDIGGNLVWSFGVVIYEILTQKVPYGDLSVIEVAKRVVMEDLRLQLPSHIQNECPEITELMKKCFETVPEKRPSFEEIHKLLATL